jgi:subtilase family serine protease
MRNVIHRDRSPYPAGRLRRRGRATLGTLALAVPASLLVLGMTAAGSASASTSHPATAGRALAKTVNRPDYKHACAAARAGHFACLALIRTNVPHHLQAAGQPNAAPTGDGYGPSSLQSAYKLPSSTAGSGQTVAVVDAYNDPSAVADLATYRAAWGQPACSTSTKAGCLSVVNQNGAASPLPANAGASGWDVEESLDVDMVSAICPNCHIILAEANSPDVSDLGAAVNSAVGLGAKFVSNSYGGAESSSDSTYDAEYYQHPGEAITASAGDAGYGVAYPAASPYVTSVGGTSLSTATNSRGWTETAWGSTGVAGTGSGCSADSSKPSWQTDTGCSRRTDNDVAADANPNTGVAVYDSYSQAGWAEVGGTSASSPMIAATYALAGAPAAGTYPASYIYAHTSSLFDVTSGSNGACNPAYLCTARAGYDGPTGWGTPDGTAAFTASGTGSSELLAGQVLHAGQDLVSPNGQYTLTVKASGNVVVSGNNCVIWSSGTTGTGNYLTMQTDGNLVIYSSAGKALWASGTNGSGSADHLSLQNDGNAIVYTSAGTAAWSAGRTNANRLCTSGLLHAGQALYSPSDGERYELTMQTDGNLVAYDNGKAIWASVTAGTGNYLTMQTDGNLVVYTSAGKALWASGTNGSGSADYLLMQNDGNVVVYTSAGKAVWASGTSGK